MSSMVIELEIFRDLCLTNWFSWEMVDFDLGMTICIIFNTYYAVVHKYRLGYVLRKYCATAFKDLYISRAISINYKHVHRDLTDQHVNNAGKTQRWVHTICSIVRGTLETDEWEANFESISLLNWYIYNSSYNFIVCCKCANSSRRPGDAHICASKSCHSWSR